MRLIALLLVAIAIAGCHYCTVGAYFRLVSPRRAGVRSSNPLGAWGDNLSGGKNFLDTVFNRLERGKQRAPEKTEEDSMLEYLDEKPWRANKIRHLPITYRPSKESWRERYRDPNDDTIYLYSQPQFKPISASARLDEVWNWPWMWTKTKAERLGYIQKYFYQECERMTVQEHMELDAFFSEFDMPARWGIIRIKELDVFNAFFLNLCFWTDFDGVRPTDLGLRPDGTVKTCAVQFHNCISSSNAPGDADHYAPAFKWDRAKSPEQAFDDIKSVYSDYPKRGLKWSSGWIDRGGWDPQQFGGQYFYAQAHSLAFHYTDDIEMNLDVSQREVQFRSSSRVGQGDWDVERLRYNQFARMLNKKGGWQVEELPRLNWFARTPYRWTELLLEKGAGAAASVADDASMLVPSIANSGGSADGAASRAYRELRAVVMPALQPLLDDAGKVKEHFVLEPRVAAALQALDDFKAKVEGGAPATTATATTATTTYSGMGRGEVLEAVQKVLRLLPERFLPPSPTVGQQAAGAPMQQQQTTDETLPKPLQAAPGDTDTVIGDPDIIESLPAAQVSQERLPSDKPWLMDTRSASSSSSDSNDDERSSSKGGLGQLLIEGVVETSDEAATGEPSSTSRRRRRVLSSAGETKVMRQQLQAMQKQMALMRGR